MSNFGTFLAVVSLVWPNNENGFRINWSDGQSLRLICVLAFLDSMKTTWLEIWMGETYIRVCGGGCLSDRYSLNPWKFNMAQLCDTMIVTDIYDHPDANKNNNNMFCGWVDRITLYTRQGLPAKLCVGLWNFWQSFERRPKILNVVFVTQQVNELHGPLAPSTAEA